jgi:polysaccharide export outer membrane protein
MPLLFTSYLCLKLLAYMIRLSSVLSLITISMLLASCGINSEFMFQPPKDYVFDQPVIDSTSIDYRIQPNDLITFDIYTNEGAFMIEASTSSIDASSNIRKSNWEYLVNSNGYVEFPVIGFQKISGLTIAQAQSFVEELFTPQFNRPYVQLRVLNRRAIIFTSPAGGGAIIELGAQSINVIEAIAKAGGLGSYAKSDDVMLFRKNEQGERDVYHIDLSSIDGIQYANMSVEAGDIIYVQSRLRISQQVSAELRSWISILSAALIIITVQSRLR